MYQFLVENTLFVVLIIVLIIWFGIAFYIFIMERNLKKIERIIESDNFTNE